jgi:hypothetical protein
MGILFAELLLGQPGQATPLSPTPDEDHLQVEVDPRRELLSIVHYISDFRVEGWRLKTHPDFDHTRRVTEALLPFKDHPAVKGRRLRAGTMSGCSKTTWERPRRATP